MERDWVSEWKYMRDRHIEMALYGGRQTQQVIHLNVKTFISYFMRGYSI